MTAARLLIALGSFVEALGAVVAVIGVRHVWVALRSVSTSVRDLVAKPAPQLVQLEGGITARAEIQVSGTASLTGNEFLRAVEDVVEVLRRDFNRQMEAFEAQTSAQMTEISATLKSDQSWTKRALIASVFLLVAGIGLMAAGSWMAAPVI